MYKAIIFDAGGVLHTSELKFMYDDMKKTLKLTNAVFKRAYKKHLPLLNTGKIDEKEYWKRFIKISKTKQPLPKTSLFARQYIKRFKLNKKVLLLIKQLKLKGYKLAILSDTITTHKEYNDKQGIYDDFEVKVFSNEVGLKKPDSRIYTLALKRLQVKPSETIFIDDILDYVEAANKLGITGLLFTTVEKLKKDLKRLNVI